MPLPDLRTLQELNLENQRVFVRLDLDLPVDASTGELSDTQRLVAALPTLQQAASAGARIIIGSHRGQPRGKVQPELSLEPIGQKLAELTQWEIILPDDCLGDAARKAITDVRPGQAVLLENLRFQPGEESNDETFAKELASMADVYVNDALAASNREHASLVALPRLLRNAGAGLALHNEVTALRKVVEPELPLVAIVGGTRLNERFDLIASMIKPDRTIFFGGAIACLFHAAQGLCVGTTKVDAQEQARARTLLEHASLKGARIVLPKDFVVTVHGDTSAAHTVPFDAIAPTEDVVDVGPVTLESIRSALGSARTALWLGAMGWAGHPVFSSGTLAVARLLAGTSLYSVVIGAAAIAALRQAGDDIVQKISHVSAGGGAALEILEGRRMPALEVLRRPEL